MFIPLSLSVTTGTTLLTTFASFISISGAVSIPRDVFPTKVEARDGPVTMMIVGDSISQGHEGEYTWRGRLMDWIVSNNINAVFVGPYAGTAQSADWSPPAPPPLQGSTDPPGPLHTTGAYSSSMPSSYQLNHFAIWGRQINQDKNYIHDMVAQYQPDYLLVELGFNDLGWWVSGPQDTLASMKTLVDNARSAKPNLKFAIANVPYRTYIPGRDDLPKITDQYNQLLSNAIPQWSTSQSPIAPVYFREIYSCELQGCPASHDGLHPNDQLGCHELANAFSRALHDSYGMGQGYWPIPSNPAAPACTAPVISAEATTWGIHVSWPKVSGSYSYQVQEGANGAALQYTGYENEANGYSKVWTSIGDVWSFQVRTDCGTGIFSGWSNTVTVTAKPSVPPGPTNIHIQPLSDGFTASWTPPTGWDVSEYQIIYFDTTAVGAFLGGYSVTGTSTTMHGLTPGHNFALAIVSWGPQGGGFPVGASGVVVGSTGTPPVPRNLKVVSRDPTTVRITYDVDPSAAGYYIYSRNVNNATDFRKTDHWGDDSGCRGVAFLFPGVWNYEFCVTAYNGDLETDPASACVMAPSAIDSSAPDCPPATKTTVPVITPSSSPDPIPPNNPIATGGTSTISSGTSLSSASDVQKATGCALHPPRPSVCNDPNNPYSPFVDLNPPPPCASGVWLTKQCTDFSNNAVGPQRWAEADCSTAWQDSLDFWNNAQAWNAQNPSCKYADSFTEHLSNYFHGPDHFDCTFENNGACNIATECGTKYPAGFLILESLAGLHQLWSNVQYAIDHTTNLVNGEMAVFVKNFTQTPSTKVAPLTIVLDVINIVGGVGISAIWSSILKGIVESSIGENAASFSKDFAGTLVLSTTTAIRDFTAPPQTQSDIAGQMTAFVTSLSDMWSTRQAVFFDQLFAGRNQENITALQNIVEATWLLEPNLGAIVDNSSVTASIGPVLWGSLFNAIWYYQVEQTFAKTPFIFRIPKANYDCNSKDIRTATQIKGDANFEGINYGKIQNWLKNSDAQNTKYCAPNGDTFFFLAMNADGSGTQSKIERTLNRNVQPNNIQPTNDDLIISANPGGTNSALPGNNLWGNITIPIMISSAWAGFVANGYKNGYGVPAGTTNIALPGLNQPESGQTFDGSDITLAYGGGVSTPGFFAFPICTNVRAFVDCMTSNGNCKNWPCGDDGGAHLNGLD